MYGEYTNTMAIPIYRVLPYPVMYMCTCTLGLLQPFHGAIAFLVLRVTTHTHTHIHTHTHAHTHTRTHTQTETHTHMHVHIHTHGAQA